MSIDVAAIVERARLTAAQPSTDGGGNERARLERVAQEFESMLLVQVLRGMRNSGKWDDEEEGGESLGAESMFETIDVELATHLARIKGLGLSKEMLESFDRMNIAGPPAPPAPLAMPLGFAMPAVPALPVSPNGPRSHGVTEEQPKDDLRVPVSPWPGSVNSVEPLETPVDGNVTSSFGWRRDPFTGAAKFHKGVDLKAAYGEDIQAAGEGRVVFSGQQGGYGTTVLIEHADGSKTRYAHLSVALVGLGDVVASGQPIGRAGRSGRATGTHLHFEVIAADGRHMDPKMALARHTGHAAD